jgi:hypothetical protein
MELFISVQAELFSCLVLGITPTGMCVLRLDCSAPRVWFCYSCSVSVKLDTLPAQSWIFSFPVKAELFSCPVDTLLAR